ncbi:MAG: RNA methyltransferase [Oscillospiraceae bacterium]|nr:RNA methyltransferase [Oscillospiraceae bacterium]
MSNIIEITDFMAEELDVYARLTEAQLLNREEPKRGQFIAESPKVIHRALDAGCHPLSFLCEKSHINGEARDVIARCGDIPVYTAEFDVLTCLTGYKLTRGMLCAMLRPSRPTVEEICRGARRVAVLEDVMNPTNLGAIFRSAAALGVDAVLLTAGCSDPLYRRSARVSMGTVFQVPWTFFGKDEDWQKTLASLGFKTCAMALLDDTLDIDDERLGKEEKLAIVLGTEGDGLKLSTIAECDYTVKIPMSHGVDSLNVAAASAVAFWELCKK